MGIELSNLAEIRVLDTQGESLPMARLWQSGPTVMVWLRHFGCSFCLTQTKVLMEALPRLEAAGGRVVLIGNGTPDQARRFQQIKAPTVTVVTDPERVSYRALGAYRSLWGMLGARDFGTWRHGRGMGVRQEGRQGDPLQLGATLVVEPPQTVLFSHINSSLGDHAEVAELLEALGMGRGQPAATAGGVPV